MFAGMTKIRMYWHLNEGRPNFGDILNPYLVEKISGKKPVYSNIQRFSLHRTYVCIGSVMSMVNSRCIVWGAGIMLKDAPINKAKFLAVRGPLTGKRLSELGYVDPEVYGDPALILPRFYQPSLRNKVKVGIIPHYVDYDKVKTWVLNDDFKIINLLNPDPEEVIDDIASCDLTISSSLHGLIVSQAYGVKSLWAKFSNNLQGDGVKFKDYFASVGIEDYAPLDYVDNNPDTDNLPSVFMNYPNSILINRDLDQIIDRLLEVCPFYK